MNIRDLTDEQLATCVDEYCKRVLRRAYNDPNYTEKVHLHISCYSSYPSDKEIEIGHNLEMGGYSNEVKSKSNNAILAVDRLLQRLEEEGNFKPTVITAALPAPAPAPEYTPYDEVLSAQTDEEPL